MQILGITALVLLFVRAAATQVKPANVGLGTWVREDPFAGMLANDYARTELAMK